jgi:hypothetical protein
VALEQVFPDYFGFSCQFSFHRLLHIHHYLSSGAGTIGQLVADVPSAVSSHSQENKKKTAVGTCSAACIQRMPVRRFSLRVSQYAPLHVSCSCTSPSSAVQYAPLHVNCSCTSPSSAVQYALLHVNCSCTSPSSAVQYALLHVNCSCTSPSSAVQYAPLHVNCSCTSPSSAVQYALLHVNCSCTSPSSAVHRRSANSTRPLMRLSMARNVCGLEVNADTSSRSTLQLLNYYYGLRRELSTYRCILGIQTTTLKGQHLIARTAHWKLCLTCTWSIHFHCKHDNCKFLL